MFAPPGSVERRKKERCEHARRGDERERNGGLRRERDIEPEHKQYRTVHEFDRFLNVAGNSLCSVQSTCFSGTGSFFFFFFFFSRVLALAV